MELKGQEISQETKDRFGTLKQQYPEVFSLRTARILDVQTWLQCMLAWEIALPVVKNLTLCLLSITAGFNRKLRHWSVQEASEKASAIGPAQSVMVPKKSAPGEPPRHRMCMDFRKINELQPKMQRVDKQTNNTPEVIYL